MVRTKLLNPDFSGAPAREVTFGREGLSPATVHPQKKGKMQTILEEAKVSLDLFPGWSGGSSGAEVTVWQVLKESLGLACSF